MPVDVGYCMHVRTSENAGVEEHKYTIHDVQECEPAI